MLRGLGLRDRGPARRGRRRRGADGVGGAQPPDLAGGVAPSPLPAVAVPAAYLAVQEYGQRLAYALDGFEFQEEAENRECVWNMDGRTRARRRLHLPVKPVAAASPIGGATRRSCWTSTARSSSSPDRGPALQRRRRRRGRPRHAAPEVAARADAVRAQSEAAYRRAAGRLGNPTAPTSPEKDWVSPASSSRVAGSPTSRPTNSATAPGARGSRPAPRSPARETLTRRFSPDLVTSRRTFDHGERRREETSPGRDLRCLSDRVTGSNVSSAVRTERRSAPARRWLPQVAVSHARRHMEASCSSSSARSVAASGAAVASGVVAASGRRGASGLIS